MIIREYFKNKQCLTYPNVKTMRCFSNIQDCVTNIIRKDSTKLHKKTYIRTVLSVIIDYSFINCQDHKNDIIEKLENISINLFLYNWCKDTNKLLSGHRSDFDSKDEI